MALSAQTAEASAAAQSMQAVQSYNSFSKGHACRIVMLRADTQHTASDSAGVESLQNPPQHSQPVNKGLIEEDQHLWESLLVCGRLTA